MEPGTPVSELPRLQHEVRWRQAAPVLWFLRGPLRPWSAAGAAAVGIVLLFVACTSVAAGRFALTGLSAGPDQVIMLFFTLSLGFLAGIARHLFPATRADIERLRATAGAARDLIEPLQQALQRYPRRELAWALVPATLISLLHIGLLGPTGTQVGVWWAASLCNLLLWLFMFQLAVPLVHNARLLSLLGRCCRIPLLAPQQLAPFGHAAVRPCALIIVLQCSYAVFLLSDRAALSAGLVLGLLASMGLIVALFMLSLRGVRQQIRAEREAALARLDAQLERFDAATAPDRPADVEHYNGLLSLRDRIRQLSSWPLGVAGVRRLFVYLVLVPLTWVGAALVETVLERWL